MKIWGNGGIAPAFLTSTLDRSEWSATHPGHFTPVEFASGTRILWRYSPKFGLGYLHETPRFTSVY
jgi:hypothetical protein